MQAACRPISHQQSQLFPTMDVFVGSSEGDFVRLVADLQKFSQIRRRKMTEAPNVEVKP